MKKTLLVLGAGASKDFCRIFPTGLELIKEINYHFITEEKISQASKSEGIYLSSLMNDLARVLGDDKRMFKEIKNQLWNAQLLYEHKSLRDWDGSPESIDSFIASRVESGKLHEKAVDIIKYSIYYLLKGYEQAYAEGNYPTQENWIRALVRKVSQYSFESIINNLSVLTFNYDRSFEMFFGEYLCAELGLSAKQSIEIHQCVKHVYGSLGALSDVPLELRNDDFQTISGKYKHISLMNERRAKTDMITRPESFEVVHFLGFGYDQSNLDILNLDQFKNAQLKGTAYGFLEAQIRQLKSDYSIEAKNLRCSQYIAQEFQPPSSHAVVRAVRQNRDE